MREWGEEEELSKKIAQKGFVFVGLFRMHVTRPSLSSIPGLPEGKRELLPTVKANIEIGTRKAD